MKFFRFIFSFFFKIKIKKHTIGEVNSFNIATLKNGYEYTSVSDLITQLQLVRNNLGDIPVVLSTNKGLSSCLRASVLPFYMEGGFLLQKGVNSNNKPNWVQSKKDFNTPFTFPCDQALYLTNVFIDKDDTFKDIEVQNLDPKAYANLDELERFQRNRFGGSIPNIKFEKIGEQLLFVAQLSNGLKGYGKTRAEAMDLLEMKLLQSKA